MTISTVRRLWRYPVKSIGGEEVTELQIGPGGVVGDRAYGFFDVAERRLVSAKRARQYGKLLQCQARLVGPPGPDDAPVEVTFPDGRIEHGAQGISQRASELLGREVHLVSVTGSVAQDFRAPGAPTTFADLAPVHVLSTGTLDQMAAAYPGGAWDARRFRPNILVEAPDVRIDDLLGCDLQIGAQAVLHVVMPTPRCVMTTLAQATLPHDAGILRTMADVDFRVVPVLGAKPCAGVYADIVRAGVVRPGDAVSIDRVPPRCGALVSALESLEGQQS
jgi:uncharacterized protein YcbX